MASDQEITRKRKINVQDFPSPRIFPSVPRDQEKEESENDLLALSLSSFPRQSSGKLSTPQHQPPPPPPPPSLWQSLPQRPWQQPPVSPHLSPAPLSFFTNPPTIIIPSETISPHFTSGASGGTTGPSRTRARRSSTSQYSPREGKSEIVPPQYPWATNRRATVYSLGYLLSKQISSISGDVHCKRCERQYSMEYDLRQKFMEIGTFIAENKSLMHDRAPKIWMNPTLPTCRYCEQENCVKPIIADKKKSINWLFLLLGQLLGCCALEQLKYFCKHTKNHRTGAKDRVLYLTYLGLCKQLDPNGPFDR
ncbi:uncharacterized protein LOC142519305 [Primulina tabacum]|uniref:uncharacterized protein LOC142519305 n=1 Tax=Primulina tabacum TaxID=48773 RepID=UPI003F5ACF54